MTSVTTRTGTNRPTKCTHPEAPGGPEQPERAPAEDGNFPGLEAEPPQETFHDISTDTRQGEARRRCHGDAEEEEKDEEGADVLARFVPVGGPAPVRPQRDPKDPPDDQTEPTSTTSLGPTWSARICDGSEGHSLQAAEGSGASLEGRGVSIVLGGGRSPEDDPDHSMLKFAVFEVQDLTEELKKLRDLLDTFSESGGLDPSGDDPAGEARPGDLYGGSEDWSRTRHSSLGAVDRHGVEAGVCSTSTVDSSSVEKGCLRTKVKVDCKTRSEVTCRSSSASSSSSSSISFAGCEVEGQVIGRCSFQGFGNEVAAAVQ